MCITCTCPYTLPSRVVDARWSEQGRRRKWRTFVNNTQTAAQLLTAWGAFRVSASLTGRRRSGVDCSSLKWNAASNGLRMSVMSSMDALGGDIMTPRDLCADPMGCARLIEMQLFQGGVPRIDFIVVRRKYVC